MTDVYISIVNFNGAENTLACLKSLETLKVNNLNLFVTLVDNASEEPLESNPAAYKSFSLIILKNEQNRGYAGGHNVAIRYALQHGADFVLLLNNDTIVSEDLLTELMQAANKEPDSGVIVPKIYFAKGYEFHKNRYRANESGKVIWYAGGIMDWQNVMGKNRGVDEVDTGQYDNSGETELITGCCLLVKRNVFENVGLFNESFFLYYEDTDFNERIKRAGYGIFYQPKGYLWHKNAGSTGGSGSELQDYFISRNRLMFGMKYAPARTKLALMKESVRLLLSGREWQKKGVRDFYLRRFGKGSFDL